MLLIIYSQSLSMHREPLSEHDLLLQSSQYVAHPNFDSYARWESMNTTSNELRTVDGNPAMIVIVGQVFAEKLSVQPLGNFQTRQQRNYQDVDSGMKCSNTKLVVVLKHPVSPAWHADFITAIKHFDKLEKAVAKNKGQRQWFIDAKQEPPTLQFSFPLWEEKVCEFNSSSSSVLILSTEIQKDRTKQLLGRRN
jgi:hypothetical protein